MSETSATKSTRKQTATSSESTKTRALSPAPAGPYGDILALQRTAGNQAVGQLLQGTGQPLDEGTREFMEGRFGEDFDEVRVHTGSNADAVTKQYGAHALAAGNDVIFRDGAYQPGTAGGDRLIAHELTHVVQQGPAAGLSSEVGFPGDRFEQEAETASRGIASNEPIQATPSASAPAVQASLSDYLPESLSNLQDAALRKAIELLGPLDRSTVNRSIEIALNNDLIWSFLIQHPKLAPKAKQLEWLRTTQGAIGAFFDFITDPNSYKDDIKAFFDPHMKQAGQFIKSHGDDILADLNLPAHYREALWEGMGVVGDLTYSAAEMVVFDVVIDTIFFWNLQSEHDIFDEAWKNYNDNKIDALDLILEHISILINVVGRAADLVPLILTVTGTAGGGAGGGTVGSVVPGAGTAAVGGTGAGAGGTAGLAASEVVGLVASVGPAGLEIVKLAKAIGERLIKEQTEDQKKQDVQQVWASLASLVSTAFFAFMPGLAMRFGRAVGRQIKKIIPEVTRLLSPKNLRILGIGGVRDSRPSASSSASKGQSPHNDVEPQMHPRIAERRAAVQKEKATGHHARPKKPDADPGNLVEFPGKKPTDNGPKPRPPEEAALPVPQEEPMLKTGTDNVPVSSASAASNPDAPRAMATGDEPPHKSGQPKSSKVPEESRPSVPEKPGDKKREPDSSRSEEASPEPASREGQSSASSERTPDETPTETNEGDEVIWVDDSVWRDAQQAPLPELEAVRRPPERVRYQIPRRGEDTITAGEREIARQYRTPDDPSPRGKEVTISPLQQHTRQETPPGGNVRERVPEAATIVPDTPLPGERPLVDDTVWQEGQNRLSRNTEATGSPPDGVEYSFPERAESSITQAQRDEALRQRMPGRPNRQRKDVTISPDEEHVRPEAPQSLDSDARTSVPDEQLERDVLPDASVQPLGAEPPMTEPRNAEGGSGQGEWIEANDIPSNVWSVRRDWGQSGSGSGSGVRASSGNRRSAGRSLGEEDLELTEELNMDDIVTEARRRGEELDPDSEITQELIREADPVADEDLLDGVIILELNPEQGTAGHHVVGKKKMIIIRPERE